MSIRSGSVVAPALDFLRERKRETGGGGGGIALPDLLETVDFPLAFAELAFAVAVVCFAAVPAGAPTVGVEAAPREFGGGLL
jgi:hypothetical protein